MTQAAGGVKFRVLPGFATPFVLVDHPSALSLNSALRALFLERERTEFQNPNPTMRIRPGLFESRFDLFDWADPCVLDLRAFCWAALLKAVQELSGYSLEDVQALELRSTSWFHVTRTGGYFGQHNHSMASWSGVYCVDPGERSESNPESGALVFAHPAMGASSFIDLGNANLKDPWGVRPTTFHLDAGQLLLFPSWLMHQVMPYLGRRERITVAFNTWFRQRELRSG